MRIFDETKTRKLEDFDQNEGYLKPDKLVIHHEAVLEKVIKSVDEFLEEYKNQGKEVIYYEGDGYYLVTATYPNGGKDVEAIRPLTEPGKEAWDEEEEIAVFVPYTEKEKAENEIYNLKRKLSNSDYKAIKYAEGYISEDEYSSIRAERQSLRDRINELQEKYNLNEG